MQDGHMGDKIIYVRKQDEGLWQWAVEWAGRTRRPLSGVVLLALERLRADVQAGKDVTPPAPDQ